ncbi:MAG: hypothetical protein HQ518_27460 [Rhodopirellula sp.]|nr:hypothetical protein [Rhodopirellula sp.]
MRDILELEVMLFGGVSERPEPVFGRDSYEHVLTRTTRSMENGPPVDDSEHVGKLISSFEIDIRTRALTGLMGVGEDNERTLSGAED